MTDYDRIARAIHFISERVTEQPGLEEIAAHLQLSPFHFQRLFSRWAGITPKRFLQSLTLEQGKRLLEEDMSLLEVSDRIGLSSGSRLHDHFVQLEAVTPGEYRSRGAGLNIRYGVQATPFGDMFLATTQRGVCRAAFLDDGDPAEAIAVLQSAWPRAMLSRNDAGIAAIVDHLFGRAGGADRPLSLHVSGTNFQIAVWKALLRIPPGSLVSYGRVASALGRPRSARAVGNAIGANPVAFLIPCHRVIQRSGALGGYRWGDTRKRAIQVWEQARAESDAP
jgi:AraC family transcriptional regulator of adaptative response/methylated-DNA-[protein]-cysteine methyltransferase